MIRFLIVCAALGANPPQPDDEALYATARVQAGRDAERHVQLALWCEARGMLDRRIEHLAIAVRLDPENRLARGLMGMVADDGKWRGADALAERQAVDPEVQARLARYADHRDKAPKTADGHWKLALWCEENALPDQARVHLLACVRLDPSREVAWKRLGCKNVDGRWLTEPQIASRKADAEAQKKANRQWMTRFEKIRADMKNPRRLEAANHLLSDVNDPRAVPAALKTFGGGDARDARVLIQLLGQIDSRAASRALAEMAIFWPDSTLRGEAAQVVSRRDPREFADRLIGLLRDPVRYRIDKDPRPGRAGILVVEGKDYDTERRYTPRAPQVGITPDWVGVDESGLPVAYTRQYLGKSYTDRITGASLLEMTGNSAPLERINAATNLLKQGGPDLASLAPVLASSFATDPTISHLNPSSVRNMVLTTAKNEHSDPSQFGFGFQYDLYADIGIPIGQMQLAAERSAIAAGEQLRADAASLDVTNTRIKGLNERVADVLNRATQASLPAEREPWRAWWIDQMGFRFFVAPSQSRRTVVEEIPVVDDTPVIQPVVVPYTAISVRRMSCFAAGTPVRTETGPRPIETLKVGDRVLAQDCSTGNVAYCPIEVVHHNPPSETFRVAFRDNDVVASAFHRFWIPGRGWKMARDLKPGDRVRTLGGIIEVKSVATERTQPVYNLDVADFRTFFVGRDGVLVHDNSLPDFHAVPFDAPVTALKSPPGSEPR